MSRDEAHPKYDVASIERALRDQLVGDALKIDSVDPETMLPAVKRAFGRQLFLLSDEARRWAVAGVLWGLAAVPSLVPGYVPAGPGAVTLALRDLLALVDEFIDEGTDPALEHVGLDVDDAQDAVELVASPLVVDESNLTRDAAFAGVELGLACGLWLAGGWR